jgi:hypothetical protein
MPALLGAIVLALVNMALRYLVLGNRGSAVLVIFYGRIYTRKNYIRLPLWVFRPFIIT